MKRIIYSLSLTLFAFPLSLFSQAPTWADDIACILYNHCTTCHHPGGIAPVSFMTYGEASSSASNILAAITDHVMPPWPPDANYQTYAHERKLSTTEITKITDWINGGTPQGNPGNAPAPPVYISQEVITSPDISLQIPTYTLTNASQDLYRAFAMPAGNPSQAYITGIEVVPGNRSVVHHVLIYQDSTNTPITNDNNDPLPGYTSFGGTGSNTSKLIGAWVPGESPVFYPSGMGVRLSANTNIVLQIHYPAGFSGQVDSTKVNFRITTTPGTREVSISPLINHLTTLTNGPLVIPGDSIKTFYANYNVPINATLIGVAPHMHLIGRSIKSYGVTALNDTLPFIDIPDWNFHWQGSYFFRRPVKIPIGTHIKAEALYDNTSANPWNPNTPPFPTVTAGEATTDEMMLIYFEWLYYQTGDENIVIDTVTQDVHGFSCAPAVGTQDDLFAAFALWPNPARDHIRFDAVHASVNDIYILDAAGRRVRSLSTADLGQDLDVSAWPNGVYFIRCTGGSGTLTRKFIVSH